MLLNGSQTALQPSGELKAKRDLRAASRSWPKNGQTTNKADSIEIIEPFTYSIGQNIGGLENRLDRIEVNKLFFRVCVNGIFQKASECPVLFYQRHSCRGCIEFNFFRNNLV